MVKDTKLYDILEVGPNDTEAQIKKAYNKLSKIWHPDKHQDPEKKKEATIKFQEINQAKNVLVDEEKRKVYDQVGMDMFKHDSEGAHASGSGHNPFGDFGNFFSGGFPFGMGGFPGGMGGMGVMGPGQKKNAPEHINEQVEASLEDIVNQKSVNVNYKQNIYCTKCNGEGTKNGTESKCKPCDGKGVQVRIVKMGPMIQQMVGECSNCKGKGSFIEEENKCDGCNGKGFLVKDKNIQIPLNTGVLFEQDAVIEGKGHQLKNQKTHLVIKVRELPHKTFKRLGNDLYMEMELKLYQALFGFDKVITHLDGRKLHVSCSGKTDFNTIRKINGEGILNPEKRKGDLYIRFIFNLPNFTTLPADTKNQLKSLLQSFDKTEVLNETTVNKSTDLVKTICSDLKQEQSEKVSQLIDKLKGDKSKTNHRHPNMDESGNDGQPQCVQQ
jgi:DnaJ family protein A protein 2